MEGFSSHVLLQQTKGAIHSTKISGNFGPKLNGSVLSNRKSFEKTGPPFEVDPFSRLDRLEFLLNGSRQERMSFSLDRAQKATKPTEIFYNKERIFRVIFFSLRLISLSVSLVQWCLLTWRNGKLWRQSGRFHTQPGDTVQKSQSPGSYQGTGWQQWAPPVRPEVQPIDALKRTFLVFWEDNFCLKGSLNQCPMRSGW